MIFDTIFFKTLSGRISYSTIEDKADNNNFITGYIIDEIDDTFPNFFFQNSFFKTNNRFCFALKSSVLYDKSKDGNPDFLNEYLGPIFFNKQYFKLNNCPVIAILISPNQENDENIDLLLNNLKISYQYLGYDMFYYCFLGGDNKVIKTNSPLKLNVYNRQSDNTNATYSHLYYDLLESSLDSLAILFFFLEDKTSFENVYSELMEVEEKFKQNSPQKFLLLREGSKFRKLIEGYEIKIQVLKKDLESKQVYIDSLNIPENTLNRVSRFYYYEYEILPTWYKQFGHIIKVLMGKRTFRSLFSDKVKKYKD